MSPALPVWSLALLVACTGSPEDGRVCEGVPQVGLPCGPGQWGPCCRVIDGLCTDPERRLPTEPPPLTDARIASLLEPSTTCLPRVLGRCPGGGALVYGAHGDIGWTLDFHDAATRDWVARYWSSDETSGVCGNEGWFGDPRWQPCAAAAREWLGQVDAACWSFYDTANPCDDVSCLANEL